LISRTTNDELVLVQRGRYVAPFSERRSTSSGYTPTRSLGQTKHIERLLHRYENLWGAEDQLLSVGRAKPKPDRMDGAAVPELAAAGNCASAA
jgi:hypothetical protein